MDISFELDESGNRIGLPVTGVSAQRPDDSTIEGVRVRLERLSVEHSPDLWGAFASTQSSTLWTYMPQGPFESESAQRDWIRSVEQSADPLFYAIVDADADRAVGIASYLRIDPTNGVIEVGYLSFSGALQRTPAATEAMYLMAKNAFDRGFRRYEWKCNVLNAPSISAAERLGFSFEGVFRNAVIVKGHNRDTAWFAFTDADWNGGIKAAHEHWLSASNFDVDGNQNERLADLTKPLRHSTFPSLTIDFVAEL
ncbi:MAG: GNAT family N-acetyltransferase [Microbacteriaceae bacterium]